MIPYNNYNGSCVLWYPAQYTPKGYALGVTSIYGIRLSTLPECPYGTLTEYAPGVTSSFASG